MDSKIKDLLDEFSFDDETKTSILTEQSTYNRIPMLAKAIADANDRSISATGGWIRRAGIMLTSKSKTVIGG